MILSDYELYDFIMQTQKTPTAVNILIDYFLERNDCRGELLDLRRQWLHNYLKQYQFQTDLITYIQDTPELRFLESKWYNYLKFGYVLYQNKFRYISGGTFTSTDIPSYFSYKDATILKDLHSIQGEETTIKFEINFLKFDFKFESKFIESLQTLLNQNWEIY